MNVLQTKNCHEQFEIDIAELKDKINRFETQISSFLPILKEFEIEKGVAEVVAYVEIASKEKSRHIIDESLHNLIDIKNSKTNKNFKVKVPQIIFADEQTVFKHISCLAQRNRLQPQRKTLG